MERRFNLRAYGILINERNQVLLSDEYRFGQRFTKFPGGGLEFGEGLEDCVIREYEEETGQAIKVRSHFYTTGFYQESAFDVRDQLISVYYLVELKSNQEIEVSSEKFDINDEEGAQSLRWISLEDLKKDELSFPVDKLVAEMLINTL